MVQPDRLTKVEEGLKSLKETGERDREESKNENERLQKELDDTNVILKGMQKTLKKHNNFIIKITTLFTVISVIGTTITVYFKEIRHFFTEPFK